MAFFFSFLGIDFVFVEDIYYSLLLFHSTVSFFRDYYYRYIETHLPTSLSVFSLISYCFPHFLFLQFSFFLCISFKKLSIKFSSLDILYNYFYYWINFYFYCFKFNHLVWTFKILIYIVLSQLIILLFIPLYFKILGYNFNLFGAYLSCFNVCGKFCSTFFPYFQKFCMSFKPIPVSHFYLKLVFLNF